MKFANDWIRTTEATALRTEPQRLHAQPNKVLVSFKRNKFGSPMASCPITDIGSQFLARDSYQSGSLLN